MNDYDFTDEQYNSINLDPNILLKRKKKKHSHNGSLQVENINKTTHQSEQLNQVINITENKSVEEEQFNIYKVCDVFVLFKYVISYLNVRELFNINITGLVKQLTVNHKGDNKFNQTINGILTMELIELYRYKSRKHQTINEACAYGNMQAVQLFVNLHRFHNFIEITDISENDNTYRKKMKINLCASLASGANKGCFAEVTEYIANHIAKQKNITLKEMVKRPFFHAVMGIPSVCWSTSVSGRHLRVVKFLVEQCEADPNMLINGRNVLQCVGRADSWEGRSVFRLLLRRMTIDIFIRYWIMQKITLILIMRMNATTKIVGKNPSFD